jgi:hypothetical protein
VQESNVADGRMINIDNNVMKILFISHFLLRFLLYIVIRFILLAATPGASILEYRVKGFPDRDENVCIPICQFTGKNDDEIQRVKSGK